jgi:hypothetical protein
VIPPTRTHKQLAAWINTDPVASKLLRAEVAPSWSSTDQPVRGTRLRKPGRGRKGVKVTLYPRSRDTFRANTIIYTHDTSQTYRKHAEARAWVADFLNGHVQSLRGPITARRYVNARVNGRRHLHKLGYSFA